MSQGSYHDLPHSARVMTSYICHEKIIVSRKRSPLAFKKELRKPDPIKNRTKKLRLVVVKNGREK
jgi:hypothetical protein